MKVIKVITVTPADIRKMKLPKRPPPDIIYVEEATSFPDGMYAVLLKRGAQIHIGVDFG